MRQRVSDEKRVFAKTLRKRATDAETMLWRLLRSRRFAHIKFRRQVPIGQWVVDFISYEKHLIVEADGAQHAGSLRDERRDRDLAARGFSILRFWNNDILANSSAVADAIFVALSQSPSPGGLRPPPSPTRGEGSKRSV